jgi:predicted RNA-binding Zn-ribbon protein involved in translation (DUF1610 family)
MQETSVYYDEAHFHPAPLKSKEPPDYLLKLATLSVKSTGLALPDPVTSADAHFRASEVTNSHIIQVVYDKELFSFQDHVATTTKVKAELKKGRDKERKAALNTILNPLPSSLQRTLMRGCETGAWLADMPSTIAGIELSSDEFCDSLHIRYGCTSQRLKPACDGCGAAFTTRRAFYCPKGGLVIIRHNKVRDELSDMVARAFQPSAVRDKPKIHQCCPAKVGKSCAPLIDSKDRGDVLIRGFWEKGTDCILGVRVTDTDATSYALNPSDKVLAASDKLKKKKYLQACLEQRQHFTTSMVSVDGLLGKEAKTVFKFLAARIATKAGKSYSNVMGHLRARMRIAIIRVTHVCLRGSRIPTSQMCNRRPQWDDLVGMALLKH